jgi:cytochrome c2
VWTEALLRGFALRPEELVPGTEMARPGLPSAQLDALIDYLRRTITAR